ncbi:TonB family protein [Alteromonas sp. AMM-1]
MASETILADADNHYALQYNLANALRLNKQLSEAENAYQLLTDYSAKTFGALHLKTFLARLESYDLLRSSAKAPFTTSTFERAEKFYKAILNDLEDVPATPLHDAALIYYSALSPITRYGSTPLTFSRTDTLVEKARGLANESWGPDDVRTIHLNFLQGKLHFARGDYEQASGYLESVAERVNDALLYTHPWALKAHAMLVEAYSRMGEEDKATQHCQIIGRMTPWDDNQEPDPIYRVNPVYPRDAAIARREGYVVIEFDIDEQGFVHSPDVLEYQGSKKFIRSTLDALEQWRYAPKFTDGEPVVAQNMKVQMDFKLSR